MTAVFDASLDQVRYARHFARAMLAGWPVADDAAFCVSELSANAVVHSASRDGGKFWVHLETFPGQYVWLEVRDEGGRWIRRGHADGRPHGLHIVGELAAQFGVDGDEHCGWIAWARLELPKPGTAAAAGSGVPRALPAASEPGPAGNGHANWPGIADGHASSSHATCARCCENSTEAGMTIVNQPLTVPDDLAPAPQVVATYAAYLRARTHAAPSATVSGDHAEVSLSIGDKTLMLAFHCDRREWALCSAEVHHGEQTATFTRGELTEAVDALLEL